LELLLFLIYFDTPDLTLSLYPLRTSNNLLSSYEKALIRANRTVPIKHTS
jgi:hypothetical protein